LGAACVAMLAAILLTPAQADVRVEGSQGDVRVETDGAPLIEIFEILSERFKFHYPETIELDRTVTGSFAGPLSEVVARLLHGYDYVAQTSPAGGLAIIWIRPNAFYRQAEADKPTTRLPPAWHRRRLRNKMPYPEPPVVTVGHIGEHCPASSPICGGSR
jgi:hypothetical protein